MGSRAEAVGATDAVVGAVGATGVPDGPAVHPATNATTTIEARVVRFIVVPTHGPPSPHLEGDPIAQSIVRCRMTDGLIAHL